MEKNDVNFLESMAGMGLDSIGQNEQALTYLGMVQPDGSAAADGATPGQWRNSTTGEQYGEVVTVIPVAFKTIWVERDANPPCLTVGRYEPQTIEVEIKQPANGKGYPKMINPKTGNEVQELYLYAIILPEHPEAGILYFNPTVGSMRTCKQWNTQLKSQLLSSGAHAPIFAYSWDLACALVDNPAKKGAKMAKFVRAQKNSQITENLFTQTIKPQLQAVQQSVLALTSQEEGEEA